MFLLSNQSARLTTNCVSRNDKQVVDNLDEVYKVGTFGQIHEMQDLGDRLRLVVMSHRRIRLLGPLFETEDPQKGRVVRVTLQFVLRVFMH